MSTRRIGQVQAIVAKMVIKDKIQRFYAGQAKEAVALRRYKRDNGYCAGSPSCMEYTGEASLCHRCKQAKAAPGYKRPLWEYGEIRAKERQFERDQAARKKAKVAKRRAAA